MAIEIRELVIKATVSDDKKGRKKSNRDAVDKEDLIRECVDKVMEMIKYEKER